MINQRARLTGTFTPPRLTFLYLLIRLLVFGRCRAPLHSDICKGLWEGKDVGTKTGWRSSVAYPIPLIQNDYLIIT